MKVNHASDKEFCLDDTRTTKTHQNY